MSEKETSKTPLLDVYGTDYTELARQGKLDAVIGREDEIKRLVQILSRRKKNNGILAGDAGVGKTALVVGLAIKIANKEVTPLLENKRVIELDITGIVSGTKFRGQFEERMKGIMSEVEKYPDIILFIDEIHTIIGTGNSSGSLDVANIIKPQLASGKLQVIGATTLSEYDKSIGKDAALERRFQKVIVNPTNKEETFQILQNTKSYYEDHHSVSYSDEILRYVIQLSARYIPNRNFPDKAIDVLDEVGSHVHIQNIVFPEHIKDLEQQKADIYAKKLETVKKQDYENAAKLRDKEKEILNTIEHETALWKTNYKSTVVEVTKDQIGAVVSSMTGIPVSKIGMEENHRLLQLPIVLSEKVIGQPNAVRLTAKAIQKSRLDFKKSNKPCNLFYLGTSGVGKTLLAKELAKYMFDNENALIRINMNEYSDKISISRLTGGSPGYVGYEEGGELTNKVRNNPYSVILLDEIEKAHPDVMDVFLQVLDEGHLTDAQGNKIDFRNTIIIMTSNIGTKHLKDFGTGIGYNRGSSIKNELEIENILKKELEKVLKPEVLNRLDNIIVFNELKKENLGEIVNIYLDELIKSLAEKNYTLVISDEVKLKIVEVGYDAKYGARIIERTISNMIEDTLTELFLNGVKENSTITAFLEGNLVKYTVKARRNTKSGAPDVKK